MALSEKMKRYLLYAGGGVVALGLVIGAVKGGGEEIGSRELLRRQIRESFDVAPDCTRVTFLRDADMAPSFWDEMGGYIGMVVSDARSAGADTPEQVTVFILQDLFPECSWPPPANVLQRPDLQLIWISLRAKVRSVLGPGSEPAGASFKDLPSPDTAPGRSPGGVGV